MLQMILFLIILAFEQLTKSYDGDFIRLVLLLLLGRIPHVKCLVFVKQKNSNFTPCNKYVVMRCSMAYLSLCF